MGIEYTRNLAEYEAVTEMHGTDGKHSIADLCRTAGITRSSYYKWLKRGTKENERLNTRLAEKIEKIHGEHPDMGYRRINVALRHDYGITVNDKRVLRICRAEKIRSNLKYRLDGCTRPSRHSEHTAENVLNRDFAAGRANEKWVTDVTEFKYGADGDHIRKLYLSAILDLHDKRIVAYKIGDSNNNELVFSTLDEAVRLNPGTHPLLHSDRGFQYTSRKFFSKLRKAGITQSMSRVAHCIDNGPMEGFWGMMKREAYYGKKFRTRGEIVTMIKNYIDYYMYRRPQRGLRCMTPMEFHERGTAA